VDLLYHEATFLREQEAEAHVSFHSTAEQAAHIALKAGVRQLLLGHFSARYRDLAAHLAEARAVFSNVLVAEEGQVYGVGDGV
jgi:ribonuclease Z